METKQEYLERVLAMEKPMCPHCGKPMTLWEVPLITFSDGLGWGEPYLFLCFNDECSLYTQGWKDMEENFAQHASMRCFNYPGTEQFECMPVFSPMGGQGQIIDDVVLAQEEALKEQTKKGFSILAGCYADKDGVTVMRLLSDACEPMRVRIKAAEMIGDIGELEAIDPLRCMKTGNEKLQQTIAESISKIHERHFTRECPFCAEIIKSRAKICKNCGREVAGQ
jgi:RNA polymerase subunit RPABC4/transcription elongation factor Spt4